jgi:hypothetical protein
MSGSYHLHVVVSYKPGGAFKMTDELRSCYDLTARFGVGALYVC